MLKLGYLCVIWHSHEVDDGTADSDDSDEMTNEPDGVSTAMEVTRSVSEMGAFISELGYCFTFGQTPK